jgi:hypothetical protein
MCVLSGAGAPVEFLLLFLPVAVSCGDVDQAGKQGEDPGGQMKAVLEP